MYNKVYDIYIASCVENGGIYHYKMNAGAMRLVEIVHMDRPMYMTVENNKMYIVLRAPFGSEESGVVVYDIDNAGRLVNPSEVIGTKGSCACHIAVHEGNIYCANYISGSVIRMSEQLVQHQGKGVNPIRQDGPHVHYVGMTPDQKYLCVTDLGLDAICLYYPDMRLHKKFSVPEGHGVRHLTFSEDGKWLFAVNELKSTVAAFSYEDGELELVDICSCIPESYVGVNTAAAIRVRDECIYVSNRGHDSIALMTFENCKLSLVKLIDCGGKGPRDFNFLEDMIVCTNEKSDSVTFLEYETACFVKDKIDIPQPICVCVTEKLELEIKTYDDPGYKEQIDYNGWRVALVNYKPELELNKINYLESHQETDEVFVLLEGNAGLLIGENRKQFIMEIGKIYNVPCGVWHRPFMTKGAKILIVENTDTGAHNTKYLYY